MSLITIAVSDTPAHAHHGAVESAAALERCRHLEEGHILFLPHTPLRLSPEEHSFLLGRGRPTIGHKNIAYQPQRDRLIGYPRWDRNKTALVQTLQRYSSAITALVSALVTPYAKSWRVDTVSFRSTEEAGRKLRGRSRNDLLHTDAFPGRPTNGDRILRVFTNINPTHARRWITTDPFDVWIERFVHSSTLPSPGQRGHTWQHRWRDSWSYVLPRLAGWSRQRSAYDRFMLQLHDCLKRNRDFQASTPRHEWVFPPYSSWILFSDFVPHAAVSGRHALEQTYIVPHQAMTRPEKAPVNILQRLYGVTLITS